MLTAYFDDSGSRPTESIAVVAGYLGTVRMWDDFCIRWSKLLADYGIKQVHRVDLENGWGEFKGWDSPKHIGFIKKCMQ